MLKAIKARLKNTKLVEELKGAAEENVYDIYDLPVFRTYFPHDFKDYYKRLLVQYAFFLAIFFALVSGWVFMVLKQEALASLTGKVR